MTTTLLKGAQVITMVSGRPDSEATDVLVENDTIAAVGSHTGHSADEVIDCTGRVVMPGLVNAHLHAWQTALRAISADWTLSQYLANTHGTIARLYTPEDMRIATLAGGLTQIESGTTTVGDWCHNARSPEHADAAIDGLTQARIRAVLLHGASHAALGHRPTREIDRLLDGPIRRHPLLTLGMAVRGPQLASEKTALGELHAAKDRGIIASMHQSGGVLKDASWHAVLTAGLFGPHTNIVHGAGLTDEWVKILVDRGVTFTTTPENELGQGHGAPITARLLACGSAPSLGTDTDCIIPGEVLTAARIALAHQRVSDHEAHRRETGIFSMEPTVSSKQALAWATIEGARALGLADRVGTLAPGMQADLAMVDTRGLNLWPAHDPIAAALHARPDNIEAVMIGGRWRKRDHALLDVDAVRVREELGRSGERIVGKFREPGAIGSARQSLVDRVARHRVTKELRVRQD